MCKSKVPDIDALYANQHPPVRFTQNFLSTTVRGQGDGDYLSCPLGVLFLLTTLLGSGGARGKTATQIANTLKLTNTVPSSDLKALRESGKNMYCRLTESLVGSESNRNQKKVPVVTISNAVFVKKDYDIRHDFKFSLENDYRAKLEKLDFSDHKNAVETINKWIRNRTHELIPNFFRSPNELPKDAKLALVNVFTFKEEWEESFLPAATEMADFWIKSGKTIRVQMMSDVQPLPYARFSDKGFSLIEKPLVGKRFSLVVLLPNQRWDMKKVDEVLNGFYLLKDLVDQAIETAVSIKLPRFKIESQLDLIPYLRSLGVSDLFEQGLADLSGVTDSHKLYVNMMIQGAVLKVNEAGVEATAATAMMAVPMSLLVPNVQFHVDQPFVCFIYDRHLKMPLYAARVTNPRER
ncbi:Neuroserpin [Fasciola gigantica]|uniref:Neuroserpin n=1 Tax=Fasciola gigantica TaxID=46835 RepID=A0A504YR08_FASGI|nr:Neuroserpin [Fasciola gigantica]